MMNERKCPECGAAFTPQSKTQVCCSQECQKKRKRRIDKESHRRFNARQAKRIRDFGSALKVSAPVGLDRLTRARKKPENTSDVRWRIELRRRQNPGYYDLMQNPTK